MPKTKYGQKCQKNWRLIMQFCSLKDSSGRRGANKQTLWAHIGYWQRQDTIIGLNSSSDWNNNLEGKKAMGKAWNVIKQNRRQDIIPLSGGLCLKSDQIPQMTCLKLGNCHNIPACHNLFPHCGLVTFYLCLSFSAKGERGAILCGG